MMKEDQFGYYYSRNNCGLVFSTESIRNRFVSLLVMIVISIVYILLFPTHQFGITFSDKLVMIRWLRFLLQDFIGIVEVRE